MIGLITTSPPIKKNFLSSGPAKSLDSNRYANAKAISSADLFGDEPDERGDTPQSRLDKFSGSQAVGSADIFGDQRNNSQPSSIDSVRFNAIFTPIKSSLSCHPKQIL